jgi:hypothetical protein
VLKLALTTNQSIKCYIFSETKIPDTRINEAAQHTINIILWGASGIFLLILLIRLFISGIQHCRRRNQANLDHNSKYFKSVHVLLRCDFCTEIIHVYTVPYNDVRYDAREYRRAIQSNWQHRSHKTKKNKTKTQHNMCWTPLCATNTGNVNKTQSLPQTDGKDNTNT